MKRLLSSIIHLGLAICPLCYYIALVFLCRYRTGVFIALTIHALIGNRVYWYCREKYELSKGNIHRYSDSMPVEAMRSTSRCEVISGLILAGGFGVLGWVMAPEEVLLAVGCGAILGFIVGVLLGGAFCKAYQIAKHIFAGDGENVSLRSMKPPSDTDEA